MSASIVYRPLRRKLGLFDSSTLAEAEDHFLLVRGLAYQEYRRFFFDQIQAIQVRPTNHLYWHMGVPFAIAALLAFVIGTLLVEPAIIQDLNIPVKETVLALCVTPFALYGLVHLILWICFGGSQEVTILTAVQRTVIPPLGYRRNGRQAIERMVEKVRAAQGASSREALQRDLENWTAPRPAKRTR